MEDNLLERVIVADLDNVSCDNENCEYRGQMFYCYLDNEKHCSIYLDYIAKER